VLVAARARSPFYRSAYSFNKSSAFGRLAVGGKLARADLSGKARPGAVCAGMDGEDAPNPIIRDRIGEQRVVRRVVDAIGETGNEGSRDPQGRGGPQPQHGEGQAAQAEPRHQHEARAEPGDEEPDRRLGQARHDIEGCQRHTDLKKS
jgi:hypothetical protein